MKEWGDFFLSTTPQKKNFFAYFANAGVTITYQYLARIILNLGATP